MLNYSTLISYLLNWPIKSRYKSKKYNPYCTYCIYQEWNRDFRRFQDDSCDAVEALREGRLYKWYKFKTIEIEEVGRKMLPGTILSALHQIPPSATNSIIPSNLVTMER